MKSTHLLLAIVCLTPACEKGTQGGNPPAPARYFWSCPHAEPVGPCGPSRVVVNDTGELSAALGRACDGDEITLAPGTYTGPFSIPAGVSVRGQGATIQGDGRAAVCVAGGGQRLRDDLVIDNPTSVSDLVVLNNGVGLLAGGGGSVSLAGLTVRVDRGVAIVADELQLTLAGSSLEGPISDEDLSTLESTTDARQTAVAGLLGARVDLEATDVTVRDFAGFGVVLVAGSGQWRGGALSGNVGTSLLIEGGALSLMDLAITDVRRAQSAGPALVSTAIVISASAHVTSSGVRIEDIDGVGILQDGATAVHNNLHVARSQDPAVWVQNAVDPERAAVVIHGAMIEDASGIGVFVSGSVGVELQDVVVRDTLGLLQPSGVLNDTIISDGVQLNGVAGTVLLDGVELAFNMRVGLLIDGTERVEDPPATVYSLRRVEIVGAVDGDDLGLVLQGGAVVDDPDVTVSPPAVAERDRLAAEQGVALDVTAALGRVGGTEGLADGALVGDGALFAPDGSVLAFGVDDAGRLRRMP